MRILLSGPCSLPAGRAAVALLLSVALVLPAVAQVRQEEDRERLLGDGSAAPQSQSVKPEQVEALIVEQTNAFRKEHKLDKLEVNKNLAQAAEYFAEYMAKTNTYGHTADGNRPADRAEKFGYKYCIVLENIAYQYSSRGFKTKELATKFVEGWEESPGHRKNMLDPDVTETGIGLAQSDKTGYWYAVQMFGRPKSKSIEFQIKNESGETIKYQIGDRSFPLPPRYTRTHMRCRPSKVAFQFPGDGKETVRPENGDRLVITGSQGEFQVKRAASGR